MSLVWWGCFFRAKKTKTLHLYTYKCNNLRRWCECNRLWFWIEWKRFMSEIISTICDSTCLSPTLAPPSLQRNLIKIIFDLLNGSHESDGEERGETKEEKAEKTLPSGCSLISASGGSGSCAGPLCFQMLHRLVPSLYNCYVTRTDDPDASAFWKNVVRCAHIYNPSTFMKWKSEEKGKEITAAH